jgi:hypothetical protein
MADLNQHSNTFNKEVSRKLEVAVASSMLKIFQSRNSSSEELDIPDESEEPRATTPVEQSQTYSEAPRRAPRAVHPLPYLAAGIQGRAGRGWAAWAFGAETGAERGKPVSTDGEDQL